jgi:tRNA-splicing ligase RtcB
MSRTQAAGKVRWVKGRPQRVGTGVVDWPSVQERIMKDGIELRGGGADEAPEVYKKLEQVLKHQGGTIKVLHRLRPIGVAMAGIDEYDPYKD